MYVGTLTEALNFDGILMGVLVSSSGSRGRMLSSASHCCLITVVKVPPFQVVFNSRQRVSGHQMCSFTNTFYPFSSLPGSLPAAEDAGVKYSGKAAGLEGEVDV